MKKAKYITSAILFILAFLLIGEFYVWHISSFYSSFPSTTLYLQEGQSVSELLTDVDTAAKNAAIDAFAVRTKVNSSFSVSIEIFGTDHAMNHLSKNASIQEGLFSSVFLGNVSIEFKNFHEVPEGYVPDRFFLTGDHTSNTIFKQALINKYAGNFPRPVNPAKKDANLIIGIWSIILFFILLLSNYEIALTKREVVVRMVSGEPLVSFVLFDILKDSLLLTAIYTTVFLSINLFTTATYHLSITATSFIVFLIINICLHLLLFKIDFRKDTGSIQNAKKVLRLSYAYKCAAIIISVFIMSSNISLITDGFNCYRQREFFEQHSDYFYVNFPLLPDDEETQYTISALDLLSQNCSHSLVDLQSWEMGVEYVYSDSNSLDILKQTIPELRSMNLTEKVYFLMPITIASDTTIHSDALDIWSAYYQGNFEFEIVPCNRTTIIAISNTGNISSSIKKNPIIILNNLGASSYEEFSNLGYISECTMFKLDESYLADLSESGQINYATNVNENYLFTLASAKRNMIAGFLFLVMVLALNTVVSKSLVYYDCKINAVEYCLKKLIGHGIIRIYARTILPSMIASIIAVIICSAILLTAGHATLHFNIVGCGMLVILDACFNLYYLQKTSRLGMTRIIKGGSI